MSLPSFDPKDLRDHADPARVERIWSRLEAELPLGDLASSVSDGAATRSNDLRLAPISIAPARGRSRVGVLLLAASLGAFAAGVVIGRGDPAREGSRAVATPATESADAVLAAGSRARTFSLPGGGAVTLAPGGTIEVGEVDGGFVTLRLVQGEASFETAGASSAVSIEAGDARVATIGASSLSIRRGAESIDVAVANGLVEVSGPEGRRTLRTGQKATSSTVTAVAVTPEPPQALPEPRDLRQVAPSEPPPLLVAYGPSQADPAPAPAPSSTATGWFSLYDTAKYDDALAAVESVGGIATVIDQSRTARELMALDHLARKKGQTILAMRALTRVATEFPEDPNAQAAAMTLGNLHRRAGNEALAAQYYELAKNSAFGEDVACRRLTSLDARAAGAVEAAKDYLTKYPEGRCRITAEDLLGDAAEAGDAPAEGDEAPADVPTAPPTPAPGQTPTPPEAPAAPTEAPPAPPAPSGDGPKPK